MEPIETRLGLASRQMSAVIMRNEHAAIIDCDHQLWSSIVVINRGHQFSARYGQSAWSSSRWLFRYGHWHPIFSEAGLVIDQF
jgi:hypothetical protein